MERTMETLSALMLVKDDLRKHPDSHFYEIYFRLKGQTTSTDIHNAIMELLKRDAVSVWGGKWRLRQPNERRKAS